MTNTFYYKGYVGQAEYDAEAGTYHGLVLGINDVVTFVADNPADLQREMELSLEDYFAFVREDGLEPQKPFAVVLTPEVYERLALEAKTSGKSVSGLANEKLEQAIT